MDGDGTRIRWELQGDIVPISLLFNMYTLYDYRSCLPYLDTNTGFV